MRGFHTGACVRAWRMSDDGERDEREVSREQGKKGAWDGVSGSRERKGKGAAQTGQAATGSGRRRTVGSRQ